MGDLAQRVERLERERRWFKWTGGIILIVVAGLLLMGQAMPPSVAKFSRAEEFGVYDRDGNLRAVFGMTNIGPKVALLDKGGMERVRLIAAPDGPSVELSDSDGRVRAVLGHAAIRTIQTGLIEQLPPSSLVLFDKDGKVIWKAP